MVITGGPGAGKTTLINALADHGFSTVPESGRAILQEEGGLELRASNPMGFAVAMLDRDTENFQKTNLLDGPFVFDRGFPDIAGYLDLMKLSIPERLTTECQNSHYSGPIFAAPPWLEIFENDDERLQDFATACATYECVVNAWKRYEYEVILLPFTSVSNRVDFMLEKRN